MVTLFTIRLPSKKAWLIFHSFLIIDCHLISHFHTSQDKILLWWLGEHGWVFGCSLSKHRVQVLDIPWGVARRRKMLLSLMWRTHSFIKIKTNKYFLTFSPFVQKKTNDSDDANTTIFSLVRPVHSFGSNWNMIANFLRHSAFSCSTKGRFLVAKIWIQKHLTHQIISSNS
jgi:hypothetical protein